jgi:hypothetical protein
MNAEIGEVFLDLRHFGIDAIGNEEIVESLSSFKYLSPYLSLMLWAIPMMSSPW